MGTATAVITGPKNGKSATLAAGNTLSVTDLGIGIAGANDAHPGTGTRSQKKRKMTLFATNGDMNLNDARGEAEKAEEVTRDMPRRRG